MFVKNGVGSHELAQHDTEMFGRQRGVQVVPLHLDSLEGSREATASTVMAADELLHEHESFVQGCPLCDQRRKLLASAVMEMHKSGL